MEGLDLTSGTRSAAPSVPSSPTHQQHVSKDAAQRDRGPQQHRTQQSDSGSLSPRSFHLEMLRQQMKLEKVPVTINSVPTYDSDGGPAADCHIPAGSSRCTLTLCADDCELNHRHHRSHARTRDPNAPLVYSRPSVSRGVTSMTSHPSAYGSPTDSPNASLPTSTTTSPHASYRRTSANYGYGYGFGARSSLIGSQLRLSSNWGRDSRMSPGEIVMMSGPPSPISDSSAISSAQNSPRQEHITQQQPQQHTQHHVIKPATSQQESTTNSPLPSTAPTRTHHATSASSSALSTGDIAPSSTSIPTNTGIIDDSHEVSLVAPHGPLTTDYWQLGNRVINLADYVPQHAFKRSSSGSVSGVHDPTVGVDDDMGGVGVNTGESLTRRDLAPAPRPDFFDQSNPLFDPRSPNPPSPIQDLKARIVGMNMNARDPTRPEIEYVLRKEE